jgi:hypothetical protein
MQSEGQAMVHVTYEVVEHDGGWAYKVGDVFSETFPTREAALETAKRVAAEQRAPGPTETIEYEDEKGEWHEEVAKGNDRPVTEVVG